MRAGGGRGRSRRADAELEAGSRAHYEDPAYYTATYASRIDDVAYYTNLAVRTGGPVLEYGIGNGRVAIPIARHGVDVVGVDQSSAMLGNLRERLRGEPADVRRRVRAVQGDMRSVRLARRFDLVMATFNTVLHLYERQDVERFLARARAHLSARGHLVLDMSIPCVQDLARRSTRAYSAPRFRHPTAGVVVSHREYFDYDPLRQVLFVSTEFAPVGRPTETWETPLAHRQFFPQEWEALLHYNGFSVQAVYGDFCRGRLTAESDTMVWHARRASGARRTGK